jgi:uncharacterized glyoxalase superfamily protein PhnB
MVRSIPDGHHTVTPYLSLQNAAEALEFYARAFGAIELKFRVREARSDTQKLRLAILRSCWPTSMQK